MNKWYGTVPYGTVPYGTVRYRCGTVRMYYRIHLMYEYGYRTLVTYRTIQVPYLTVPYHTSTEHLPESPFPRKVLV